MLNFYQENPNAVINKAIDDALVLEQSFQEKRTYMGGSRVGVECERAMQYETLKVPVDPSREFSGRILRVFERGHWVESAMVRWLRLAGFGLMAEQKDGGQFGFTSNDGFVQGHCDGIFVSGPAALASWPRLWECKGIQQKDFLTLKRKGLRETFPVYWGQVQYYQKHFGLTDNPAIWTAVNMNTMDIEAVSVPHEPKYLEYLERKISRVLMACNDHELLPRGWDKPIFKCKLCDYSARCWA